MLARPGKIRSVRTAGPQPEFRLSLVERGLAAVGLSRWALRSAAARYEYEATRWYLEAAKVDRTTGNWKSITATADDVMTSDAARVRGRIRSLIQSNGYALHAKDVLVDWTVGTGINSQIQIAYSGDATENNRLNTQAEDRKKLWMEQADATNHLQWPEMQRMFLAETAEAGGVLFYRRFVLYPDGRNRPRVLPLAYEIIPVERLTDAGANGVAKGHTLANGVELSADGYPVAYHVTMGEYNTRTERIPATDVIHGFRQDRPGQHTGMSWFAPVLPDLNYLHDILFYRLIASKVQAAIAVIVSEDPTSGMRPPVPGLAAVSGASTSNGAGDPQRFLEPGMIHRVGTGKVTSFVPNQSTDLDPVTRLVLRGVAVGLGTSYELLTGDYSQVNFAGGRLVRQDSRRHQLPMHGFVCRRLEDPAHTEWVNAELAFGSMRRPPAKANPYAVRYSQPRGDQGVNPLQDANAATIRLAQGISTLRDEVENAGGDWQDYLEQCRTERDFGSELGMLIHEALFNPTPAAGPAPAADDTDPDTDPNTEPK